MTDYRNQQIVIVGAGQSGQALARFFLARGARPVLSDLRKAEQLPELQVLAAAGVQLDLDGHTAALFTAADLIVVSPGVPLEVPAIAGAVEAGIPVLGEVEIAWRELEAPLIGITGTNGKSTVTTLIGVMLRAWGRRTFVGGNLGTPLIEAVGSHWDWLVAELSSFQLEAIDRFRPRYGMLLNISPDHLDRYAGFDQYVAAKRRLFENMGEQDVAVLNADDPQVREIAAQIQSRRVWFSSLERLDEGMSFDRGQLVWRWQGVEERFPADALQVRGQHNLENVMAALIPALLAGCPPATAWEAACTFSGLPHRMELLGERGGVCWYDDSKGTNIGSVQKSLAGLKPPVTLIAGGKDKHGDLTPLRDEIASKVAHLILLGEAAARMASAFAGLTDIRTVAGMDQAVRLAGDLTPPGGTVLLSPGCASFDMFRSYRERGERFAAAFRALDNEQSRSHGS